MRFRTIRFSQAAEDEKELLRAERKQARAEALAMGPEEQRPLWLLDDSEVQTIDSAIEHLMDNPQDFTHEFLLCVAHNVQRTTRSVRTELESWGLKLVPREKPRTVRGINSNSHNLYENFV